MKQERRWIGPYDFLCMPRHISATRISPVGVWQVGKKLNLQLARAALAKRLEAEGKSLESLSDADLQERLVELRLKQAEQKWIERAKLGGEVCLLALCMRLKTIPGHSIGISNVALALAARHTGSPPPPF